MKKWVVYLLGIVTGIVLTFAALFIIGMASDSRMSGLTLFDKPGEYMNYSGFEVFQVVDEGCALAHPDNGFMNVVLLLPDENQNFYDGQEIKLRGNQRAQRVGTYQYYSKAEVGRTVPAIRIVEDKNFSRSQAKEAKASDGKTLFDKPGKCVSKKNFQIQRVLDNGDAIALEINQSVSGYVFTSDLEVLFPAEAGNDYYDEQIIRTPRGKCARQIGTYRYSDFGSTKVIPIVSIQ